MSAPNNAYYVLTQAHAGLPNSVLTTALTTGLIPNLTNSYDLGTNLLRWRFGYLNDLNVSGNIDSATFTIGGADFDTAFVPYVGATANVNLGAFDLTTTGDGYFTDVLATGLITGNIFNATDEDNVLQIDGTTILRTGTLANNNLFIGKDTAVTTEGLTNLFIGVEAGYYNDDSGGGLTGDTNVYLGYQAGKGAVGGNSGYQNVCIGYGSGMRMTSGYMNFCLGYLAGQYISSGNSNILIGRASGNIVTTGAYNIAIGRNAHFYNRTGDNNICIGGNAGFGVSTKSYTGNVFIGTNAGFSNSEGGYNIFIGYKAGYYQVDNSNLLIIDDIDRGSAANEATKSLLYGVFDANPLLQSLRINGELNLSSKPMVLLDTSRVQRHLLIDPARFKLPAANYPGESFEGIFYTLDFDDTTEESAYCQEHIPYRWDTTTDIEIIVDWMHTGADAGTVVWGLEYKSITAGETFTPPTTTITKTTSAGSANNVLLRTAFTSKILAANLSPEDVIAFRFYRDATSGSDTLAEDARVINIHFHFIQNKLGGAT
ncbi:MAG TPA: hypothetical protein VMV32_12355 [Ignavibacteriaceae bacterium]|nr:hypothetical protein [Ignavibacteriaceae bacterium]